MANIINLRTVEDIENWLQDENHIYIGRPTAEIPGGSTWKNPYRISRFNSRQKVIQLFEKHLQRTKELSNTVGELKGKILGCWCAPYRCHGEILHKLAGNQHVYQHTPLHSTDDGKMSSPMSNMESQQSSPSNVSSRKLIVGNISESVTHEDIVSYFNLHRDEFTKQNTEVEISENAAGKIALLHLPEEIFAEALARHGSELAGTVISVKDPVHKVQSLPPSVSSQFLLSNFSPNTTVEDLVTFLGFGKTEEARKICSVALSACKSFALVVVPEGLSSRVTDCHGKELDGRAISIKPRNSTTTENVKSHPENGDLAVPEPEKRDQPDGANPLLTLAQIAARDTNTKDSSEMFEDLHISEYVMIDT